MNVSPFEDTKNRTTRPPRTRAIVDRGVSGSAALLDRRTVWSAAAGAAALGDVSTASSLGADLRATLTSRLAIIAAVSGHRDFEQNWLEAGDALNVYF